MAIKLDQIADERERKWHNIKKDQGKITEEEMTPRSKETQDLIDRAIKNMKSDAPKRTIFLNRYYIGETCPQCKGEGKIVSTQANESNGHEIPCGYCDGAGAIGVIEIKAECEQDAHKIYEERFGVSRVSGLTG